MRPPAVLAPALLVVGAACTHNVAPKITPAKIRAAQPPIQARALIQGAS